MTAARQDGVVVMARGLSERMGQPKGALLCPGNTDTSFLASIVQLYVSSGLAGVVITTEDLVDLYRSLLPEQGAFKVLGFGGGGDTGRTIVHGASALEPGVTHLWAHPVDLPLVSSGSIVKLWKTSQESPEAVVRPVYSGTVGHPVIIPVGVIGTVASAGRWAEAPMRELMVEKLKDRGIGGQLLVAVTDAGVVADFDRPEDLVRGSIHD